MNLDFDLYEGKKYSDLLKDIVKNHKAKQSQIKGLVTQLTEMVNEPGDAVMVVPLIKGYLDSDIKNDEALVKLAQILQKSNQTTETADGAFSDKDLEALFSEVQKTPAIPQEVKELPNSE